MQSGKSDKLGIRVVGKNEKLESLKLDSPKLESFAEVGKSQAKFERTERNWKVSVQVGRIGRPRSGRRKPI